MKQFYTIFFSIIALILLTSNCAKKGRPSGGEKDSLAPIMVLANPPYKTLHFNRDKIKIYFDEYIKLKDVTKQLVISPPLKFPPIITPLGTPSKYISVKIKDTLQANTTYTLNFGNSIVDNNEENILGDFKYIFSTGSYIDSLYTRGTVTDASSKKTLKNISIYLYKIDSTFTDSIIYKQKPNYVTNTLDSTLFNLTNIKKGTYFILALHDVSSNYLFNPKEDKIGFFNRTISLPQDSVINEPIALFKEIIPFRLSSPKEISKGRILFGFEGDATLLTVEPISKTTANFKSIAKFEAGKDTLNYWFANYQKDSILFKITSKAKIDTVTVFLRKKVTDSLKINSNISQILDLKDTLTLISNNPIIRVDTSRIHFVYNDSISVPYEQKLDTATNRLQFLFAKKEETPYRLQLLPKALTDIFSTQNDTLNYNFKTTAKEDYGSITLAVQEVSEPTIVQLFTKKDKLVQEFFINKNTTLNFNLLKVDEYYIRAILDTNNNKKWDTGNFLQKKHPEKIIYSPKTFPIKADWHFSEIFILK